MSLGGSSIILALVYLGIGGISCFFGFKLFRIMLALTGFIIGLAIAGALSNNNLIIMIIGGVVGAVINIASYYLSVFVMGMAFGLLIHTLITSLLTAIFGSALFCGNVIVAIAMALLGGYIAVKLVKPVTIVATALAGALAIVFGLVIVLGVNLMPAVGLPNVATLPSWAVIVWLALAAAGIVYQAGGIEGLRELYATSRDALLNPTSSKKIAAEGGTSVSGE